MYIRNIGFAAIAVAMMAVAAPVAIAAENHMSFNENHSTVIDNAGVGLLGTPLVSNEPLGQKIDNYGATGAAMAVAFVPKGSSDGLGLKLDDMLMLGTDAIAVSSLARDSFPDGIGGSKNSPADDIVFTATNLGSLDVYDVGWKVEVGPAATS